MISRPTDYWSGLDSECLRAGTGQSSTRSLTRSRQNLLLVRNDQSTLGSGATTRATNINRVWQFQAPRLGVPLFRAIDHVGIAVADLDAALEFYAEAFDMHSVHTETNEEQGVREAMIVVGDGATRLQLLAPLTPDSPIARFLDRSGPGIQQLAYQVDDVESAAEQLRAKGLRVLYETARAGTAGSRVNFVHPKDAGGVLIELVQLG
jgi:methylmalonyl-CoA/ethylmalonyl-CoA epimerase